MPNVDVCNGNGGWEAGRVGHRGQIGHSGQTLQIRVFRSAPDGMFQLPLHTVDRDTTRKLQAEADQRPPQPPLIVARPQARPKMDHARTAPAKVMHDDAEVSSFLDANGCLTLQKGDLLAVYIGEQTGQSWPFAIGEFRGPALSDLEPESDVELDGEENSDEPQAEDDRKDAEREVLVAVQIGTGTREHNPTLRTTRIPACITPAGLTTETIDRDHAISE